MTVFDILCIALSLCLIGAFIYTEVSSSRESRRHAEQVAAKAMQSDSYISVEAALLFYAQDLSEETIELLKQRRDKLRY